METFPFSNLDENCDFSKEDYGVTEAKLPCTEKTGQVQSSQKTSLGIAREGFIFRANKKFGLLLILK